MYDSRIEVVSYVVEVIPVNYEALLKCMTLTSR